MFRITADTNIYVSGLMYRGACRYFLELARRGVFQLAVSDAILDEVVDVLQRKFRMTLEEALENRAYLESFTRRVYPTRAIEEVVEDSDDNRILECAVENVSDFLISHDKDLLRRGSFEGIPIRRVKQFLKWGFGITSTNTR